MKKTRSLRMRKEKIKLYHVSKPENIISILTKGLILNELDKIFLFDNKKDDVKIAYDQLGFLDFSLFEISLKNEEIHEDKVGELILGNQFYVKSNISPKQIKFITCKTIKL